MRLKACEILTFDVSAIILYRFFGVKGKTNIYVPKIRHDRSIETYEYVSDVELIGIFEGYLDLPHAAMSFMCFAVLAVPWCKTVTVILTVYYLCTSFHVNLTM